MKKVENSTRSYLFANEFKTEAVKILSAKPIEPVVPVIPPAVTKPAEPQFETPKPKK
jgi:hypothetical protein